MLKLVIASMVFFVVSLPTLAASNTNNNSLNIIYSGNLNGEIEPCGCATAANHGGILRRTTWLDGVRETDRVLALSFGGLFAPKNPRDQIKHQSIMQGFELMGYDAIGLQHSDLVHGLDFVTQTKVPVLSFDYQQDQMATSNRKDLLPWVLLENNGYNLFFTQLTSEALNELNLAQLKAQLMEAKNQGYVTLVGTSLVYEDIDRLPLEFIDIVSIGPIDEVTRQPKLHGNTLVLQPGTRGQQVSWLKLQIGIDSRISTWTNETVSLDDNINDAARLSDWDQQYNDRLAEDYMKRVELRQRMRSKELLYLGAEQCTSCHQKEYDIWQQTDHAKAWESINLKQKTMDPDCLSCHTVAVNSPDGFMDIDITPNLTSVQCENCHGAGRDHVLSEGKTTLVNAEQICRSCHIPDHSPEFEQEAYWMKIAH